MRMMNWTFGWLNRRSGEAQLFSPAPQPDSLFPIGLVDVALVSSNVNLNVMLVLAQDVEDFRNDLLMKCRRVK